MLDLYKLEVFVRVAEEGSFSKAAQVLHLTQPAVSQHVSSLEQALGVSLFDRSRQGAGLTPTGQRLMAYAESIFRLVSEAELVITDVRQLSSGQVAVGATPGVSAYLLPDWVQSYRREFPQLMVTVQTGITSEIVYGILHRSLALAVIEGELEVTDRRLGVAPLEEVDQLVVVGPAHRWWSVSHLTIQQLDHQPMVTRQTGSQTRIWLNDMLHEHRIAPQVIAELDNLESIKRMVMRGSACAILPGYVVHDELSHGQLRAIALEGNPLRRTLKLLWHRTAPIAPITRSFLRHLCETFPSVTPVVRQICP